MKTTPIIDTDVFGAHFSVDGLRKELVNRGRKEERTGRERKQHSGDIVDSQCPSRTKDAADTMDIGCTHLRDRVTLRVLRRCGFKLDGLRTSMSDPDQLRSNQGCRLTACATTTMYEERELTRTSALPL
jgi:hypothetical protein